MSTMPIYALVDTWNSAGTTFTGIGLNVTDTASAAGSLLLDLQVGGSSRFKVDKGGLLFVAPAALTGSAATSAVDIAQTWNTTGAPTAFKLNVTNSASGAAALLMDLQVGGSSVFNVAKSGQASINPISLGNVDTILLRDTTLTAALRVGDNATTFRIYNSYTTSTNFQRMALTSVSTTLSLTGASVTASNLIPDGAVVVGVTTRVSTLIAGATGYEIGTTGDPDRWGDITGTAVGTTSDNRDWTAGTIECFTAATDVVITAKTSNFTAGALVVAVHYIIGQAD